MDITCVKMKWIRWVLWKIQSEYDSVHRGLDKVKPVYPHSTSLKQGVWKHVPYLNSWVSYGLPLWVVNTSGNTSEKFGSTLFTILLKNCRLCGILLIYDNLARPSWWMQMSWPQIGTRPSTTTMLIRLCMSISSHEYYCMIQIGG